MITFSYFDIDPHFSTSYRGKCSLIHQLCNKIGPLEITQAKTEHLTTK